MNPPKAIPFDFDKIPEPLRARAQWVCWRFVASAGACPGSAKVWTKLLISPKTGTAARVNDPDTWGSFDTSVAYYRGHRDDTQPFSVAHGIGYVFTVDDPFTFMDADHCLSEGALTDIGMSVLTTTRSYAEWSVSGSGLHVISLATIVSSGRNAEAGIEFYRQDRYATFTGAVIGGRTGLISEQEAVSELHRRYLPDHYEPRRGGEKVLSISQSDASDTDTAAQTAHPLPVSAGSRGSCVNSDTEVVEALRRDPRAGRLFRGDRSMHLNNNAQPDESRSDASLIWYLLKVTCNDADRTERLFRQSGLYRPKCDEVRGSSTYLRVTIDNVLRLRVSGRSSSGRRGPERFHGRPLAQRTVQTLHLLSVDPTLRPASLRAALSIERQAAKDVLKATRKLAERYGSPEAVLKAHHLPLQPPTSASPRGASEGRQQARPDGSFMEFDSFVDQVTSWVKDLDPEYRGANARRLRRVYDVVRPLAVTIMRCHFAEEELRLTCEWVRRYVAGRRSNGAAVAVIRRAYLPKLMEYIVLELENSAAGTRPVSSFRNHLRQHYRRIGQRFPPPVQTQIRNCTDLLTWAERSNISEPEAGVARYFQQLRTVDAARAPRRLDTILEQLRSALKPVRREKSA